MRSGQLAPSELRANRYSGRMPLRILYVEDNPLVREVTSELLSQDAREVIARSTAEEALTEFKLQSFDVVITDISLPVMSGLDLARALLALQPRVPIILASGYALTSVVQNLGPNVRTIVKPFEAAEIDSLITDLCAVRDDAARDDHAHDAA